MKRRSALAAVVAFLYGCGGGGAENGPTQQAVPATAGAAPGGSVQTPAPQPTTQPTAAIAPAQAPAEAAEGTPEPPSSSGVPAAPANIAAWGDSLTGGYSFALAAVFSERTVYNGGVGGQTSTQTLARIVADASSRNSWVNVFWMGRNNYADATRVRADIAAAVANLAPGNDKFVVLSVLNKQTETRGTAAHSAITALNDSLAGVYAGRYLDIRSYLVEQFDPADPGDVADHEADVVPGSLRVDDIHLNAHGNELAAAFVRAFIVNAGW